jgi:hypothetical protein
VEIKLRDKKPGQRACDTRDAKGKLCLGHLKRWYTASEDVVKQLGAQAEIYRCERCHTLYHALPDDHSSAGLNYEDRPVNILGWAVHPSKK